MKMFTIILVLFITMTFPVFAKGTPDSAPKMEANTEMFEPDSMDMDNKMEADMDDKMEMEHSLFIPYEDMEQAMMLANSKPTVLFFKADWCPSCKAATKDFEENSALLDEVNLVVVNYDNSKDLQTKYGVTYQHTFVQISPNGDALVKWNGGSTSELLKKIVKEKM